jgi:ketosteroid isomerase-like protein
LAAGQFGLVRKAQAGCRGAADSVAFCHCLEHIRGTRTDGDLQDMWIRSTLGLRKLNGAWKITHEHNSAPLYMDGSVQPALDLQP